MSLREKQGSFSHTFSIQCGVNVQGSAAEVMIFEGARFADSTIIDIAREALKGEADSAFRQWQFVKIDRDADRPGANPLEPHYYTCTVRFAEVKEPKR